MKSAMLTKRLLSALLLVCMLLGMLPSSVFAQTENTEAVSAVSKPATRAATNYVSAINSLATPLNAEISMATWNPNGYTLLTNGRSYYVVNVDSDGTTGHLLDLSELYYNPYLEATDVTVSGSTLINPNPDAAVTFEKAYKTDDDGNTVENKWRALLYPTRGLTFRHYAGAVSEDETYINFTEAVPSNMAGNYISGGFCFYAYYKCSDTTCTADHTYSMQYEKTRTHSDEGNASEDGFIFTHHGINPTEADSSRLLRIFRVYTQGIELYKAIKAMLPYADGNANGYYPTDTYNKFSDYLGDCIDEYDLKNVVVTDANEATYKDELDAMAETLLGYRKDLIRERTLTTADYQYIDIPVEILDFRADGIMLEYYAGIYNLRGAALKHTNLNGPYGVDSVSEGLTESTLVDHQLVYTEKTTKYVADNLKKKVEESTRTNYSSTILAWNSEPYYKIDEITTLGTWDETLDKTSTGENGGVLAWENVTTYYDMAYYLLTNLWRSVDGDPMEGTLPYNKTVTERDRLRLYMDEETGLYTLNADYEMVYDGYYIYNAMPRIENEVLYKNPYFTPINGMGFEDGSLSGDTDLGSQRTKFGYETEDMNFHFSMHAYGNFVYYRSQNLHFDFTGDDDVYFFLDGKKALDLGGAHQAVGTTLYLNDVAESLGLEDGKVYRFDMFYAERHTTASNLNFSTNINIVETETMTTKGMYNEQSGNTSYVNTATGMGATLNDGALVRDGDTIAYSFDIANTRDVPVYNITFTDETMGSYLSYDTSKAVTLTDSTKTGGAVTNIGDIEFYYRTIDDDGVPYEGNPTTKSVSEITSLIETANAAETSLNFGAYRVTMTSTADIQSLLALGIPMDCQLSVYGFKRTASESLPVYKNTVVSTCYWTRSVSNTGTTTEEEFLVKGSADRTYQVAAEPPTAQPQQIVLDYGKAVDIPVETIVNNIKTDSLASATGFAGLVTSGSHGELLTYISPSKLMCASSGKTCTTATGIFTRTATGLTYQPTVFLDSIETVYLAYHLTGCTVQNGSDYKYLLVELKLIPATSVYYESDFADGAISTVDGADMFDDTNSFYVDFNNTDLDQKRYENSVYGGKNYDLASSWGTLTSQYSAPVVDHDAGTLTTSYVGTRNWIWVQAHQNLYKGYVLNYHPIQNSHVAQIRVKFSDMAVTSGKTPNVRISYFIGEDNCEGGTTEKLYHMDSHSFNATDVTGGGWVTLNFTIKGLDATTHTTLTNLRFQFSNVESASSSVKGSVTFDYIYVGPADNAPSQDSLYFDFGNTDSDRSRYSTHGYRSHNFDVTDSWNTTAWSRITSIKVNNADETLVATGKMISDTTYPDLAVRTDFPLSFDPAKAEVFQIRFKLENFVEGKYLKDEVETNPNEYIRMRFKADGITSWTDATSTKGFSTDYLTNGQYVTLTLSLNSTFKNAKNVSDVYFYFGGIESESSSNLGILTIDYAYIGPKADAPAKDYLYFDFTNTYLDKERYANDPAYGGYNFDDDAYWTGKWDSAGNHADTVMDNTLGTISSSYSGSTEVYFYTTYSGKYSTATLDYVPTNAEVWEICFKISTALTSSANVRLGYGDSTKAIMYTETKQSFTYTTANKYITLNIPLTDSFRSTSQIVSLRPIFNGIPQGAVVTIDYIYIGTSNGIDGVRAKYKELQDWQSVSEGASGSEYQDVEGINLTGTYEPETVLESIGAGPAQRNEYYGLRNGKSNYANNIPLSFCHRGSFRTSSENSYIAVLDSLKLGMDGVEVDLQITSDGVVILSHDANLKRVTNKSSTAISSLAWDTIKDYPLEIGNGSGDALYYVLTAEDAALLNSLSNYTAHYGEAATTGGLHYPARLDDLLELLYEQAPNAIITLDKMDTQAKFVATYKLLREKYNGKFLKQAMFKMSKSVADIDTWTAAAATECGISQSEVKSSFMMLFVEGKPETSALQDYLEDGSYLKAVESTYSKGSAESYEAILTSGYIDFCKTNNIDFYPSTIGPKWAGGRDDEEMTWLHYLQMGADGIMSDRGEEFAGFMHYYNGASRTTSELIEAEHFQNYNTDSARFYMKEAADLNNNKLVNEMHDGDWLEYRNITFTGSETTLYVSAKGISGGVMKFYFDSVTEENCFASVPVLQSDYCHTITATMRQKVAKGTHTVYVVACGDTEQALLSFDSFSCAEHTNSKYLFFGFTNTAEDQARYQQASYGGGAYNFDTKDYWATNATTGDNSTSQTQFSIDNSNGVAIVNVGTAADSSVYGPKFMTTTTYNNYPWGGREAYAPLNYTPSKSDFLVVRFKIDGCTDSGANQVYFEYRYNDSSIDYAKVKAEYTFVQGQYQTVKFSLPENYVKAEKITTIGLRFIGLKPAASDGTGGTVTIDYIYVGPLQQTTDHLLIDFDGDAEDYSDIAYGGKNYDLASSYTYSSTHATAPTVSNGALSFSIASTATNNYQRLMTETNLRYVPGKNEYVQVRFKLSNATAVSGATPQLFFYWSPDKYCYGSKGYGNTNDVFAEIDVTTEEWQTVSISMDDYNSCYNRSSTYRDAEVTGAMCLMFNNISYSTLATFTIDYIYLGPLDSAPNPEVNSLYFDFTNTGVDTTRYQELAYGYVNYDTDDSSYWFKSTATSNSASPDVVMDTDEGTISLTLKSGKNAIWTETSRPDATGVVEALKYHTSNAEVVQVRFKMENFVPSSSTATPYIILYPWLDNVHPNTHNGWVRQALTAAQLKSGEYMTVTMPIGDKYKDYEYVTNARIQFSSLANVSSEKTGKVTIDYIYIGARDQAPDIAQSRSLFFDFTNTGADRVRYDDVTYGNVNYDDDTTTHWNKSSKSNAMTETVIIDQFTDTLSIFGKDGQTGLYTETSASGKSVDNPLKLMTDAAEVFQIRFKLENFIENGTKIPYVALHPMMDGATSVVQATKVSKQFDAAYLSSGEYQTLTLTIPSTYSAYSYLTSARVYFGNLCNSTTAAGQVTIDYIYIGPEEGLPTKADTYGYDSSYTTDSKLSYGSSMFVEGKGIPLMYSDKSINYAGTSTYTEISFDFTGTGFDLISRTGANQGLIRAVIYDADGKFVKVASVINKGVTELYQIPVMSIENLTHGTYTVKLFVGAAYDYGNDGNADSFGGSLDRGGEFYFDAIRIYNPINTLDSGEEAQEAYDIYQKHGEADPVYTEVRNMLITATNFNAGSTTMDGVVYLDASAKDGVEFDDENGKLNAAVAEYKAIGPNNEVYLAKGKAIAFMLEVTGMLPASIDIGAKSVTNAAANLSVRVSKTAPTALPTASDITSTNSINSSTQQYYPITILPSQWTTSSSTSTVYITIYNNGSSGILSITDIKYAFDSPNPSKDSGKTVRFLVGPEMLDEMQVCYAHDYGYFNNDDDHTATCATCDYSFEEVHTFENGVCICGAVESVEPKYELKEDLAFTMSISAGAEMTVSYNIMGADVNSYADFYLEVTKDVAGGSPVTTIYGITEDREAMTVKADPTTGEALMYQVTYKGINAKEMGDNFSTTLYAVGEDGTIYYGNTVVDSIKSFLVGKIDAEASIPELKTMAVDMLKYGAAAQVRLGYNTENLVTADLTEEQLAYATQETPEAVNNAASTGEGASVNTNITVTSRVQLNLSCIYTTATDPDAIKCIITDAEGKVLAEIAATNKDNLMLTAIYENVGAKEMRDVINATIYEGETAISKTVSWSVESYVAQVRAKTNVTEDELNMVNAMLTYGDSVAAYMEAK